MEVIYILLPLSLLIGVGAVTVFVWAVKTGQLDDLETPPMRMLADDDREMSVSRQSQISAENAERPADDVAKVPKGDSSCEQP